MDYLRMNSHAINMKIPMIVAYWKVLVDEAEQFFNRMIKELEQVCINQIIDVFISGSILRS